MLALADFHWLEIDGSMLFIVCLINHSEDGRKYECMEITAE